MEKKWLRNVETGDKYAVNKDTYGIFTLEKGGMSFGRFGKNRTTIITMGGMYVSAGTDDPIKLKAFENEILSIMKRYADQHPQRLAAELMSQLYDIPQGVTQVES